MWRIICKVKVEEFYHKSRPHLATVGRPVKKSTDAAVAWIDRYSSCFIIACTALSWAVL